MRRSHVNVIQCMRKLPDARRSVASVGPACVTAPAQVTVQETFDVPQVSARVPQVPAVASANAPRIIAQRATHPTTPSEAADTPADAAPTTPDTPQHGDTSSLDTGPAVSTPSPSFALQPPRARAATTPLGPGRFKLELTLGQKAHDQLEQLQQIAAPWP